MRMQFYGIYSVKTKFIFKSVCIVGSNQDEILIKVGQKVKELRLKKGYTSYETFAVEHDIDRKYYWSIEKGRNISLTYLKRILDIHGITFEEFFKGSGI
jgi:DNA-binding XRE family transcriptional regulator